MLLHRMHSSGLLRTALRRTFTSSLSPSSLFETSLSLPSHLHFFSEYSHSLYQYMQRVSQEYSSKTALMMALVKEEEAQKDHIVRLQKEISTLERRNQLFLKLEGTLQDCVDTIALLEDQEMKETAEEELNRLREEYEALEEEVIEEVLQGSQESYSTVQLEIKQAMGGSESSLFAEDLYGMYVNLARRQGWRWTQLEYQEDMAINRGLKNGKFRVKGEEVYSVLKHERGVHKVQRVPETEKMGRMHSSSVVVMVMPEVPLSFDLDMKDVKLQYYRSQGAGGQHVNRTDSACRAIHVPTGIVAQNQDERDQFTNKKRALEVLRERVFEKKLEEHEASVSEERRSQRKSGNISDKIRTYNWPNNRITDHRLGMSLFGIEDMLKRDLLDEFLEALQEQDRAEKLKSLFTL